MQMRLLDTPSGLSRVSWIFGGLLQWCMGYNIHQLSDPGRSNVSNTFYRPVIVVDSMMWTSLLISYFTLKCLPLPLCKVPWNLVFQYFSMQYGVKHFPVVMCFVSTFNELIIVFLYLFIFWLETINIFWFDLIWYLNHFIIRLHHRWQ